MTHKYEEKEIFYPNGTLMYRGGVKKNDFGHDFMMERGRYLTRKVNYYSRVNSPIT